MSRASVPYGTWADSGVAVDTDGSSGINVGCSRHLGKVITGKRSSCRPVIGNARVLYGVTINCALVIQGVNVYNVAYDLSTRFDYHVITAGDGAVKEPGKVSLGIDITFDRGAVPIGAGGSRSHFVRLVSLLASLGSNCHVI